MCGLKIEAQGDRVVSIRGDEDDPFSRGHLCPKAPALAGLHADPDRLRQPMRRTGDTWTTIGWDEALDEAAQGMHRVQQSHGRDALAAYVGNPNVHNLGALVFGPRLLRTLRTKNRYSATSVDQLPHMLASYLMFGHQLLLPVPDIDHTSLLLVLGANPMVSNGSLMTAPGMAARLRALRDRGGRLVVVDPRRSETAARADQHLFIRPGTDALLLLAMLHTIFAEDRVRLRHLGKVVDGLDTVRTLVAEFSPAQVAPLTGIDADTISGLARSLAEVDAGVCYGRIGTSLQPHGGLCAWLTLVLNIVTGHLDRVGGAMFTTPAVDIIDAPKGLGVGRGSFGRWRSRVRDLPEFGGELPVATMADEMLTEGPGQVRGLLTMAGNPVLSTPNGARLDQALEGLDYYVAVDFYLNETTRHAHLILPPTSPLERSHYDLIFNVLAVRNTAKLSPALFEPGPDQRHDWQILSGLTRRLARLRGGHSVGERITDAMLERLGPDRVVDLGLRAGPHGVRSGRLRGLTAARLRSRPHGVDLGALESCLPGRLPGGRIALAPEAMVEALGRLRAELREDAESLEVQPGEPSLRLIGRRQLRTNNSWMHNVPNLVSGKPRCTLLMHPSDAEPRGLAAGDEVTVTSRVGQVQVAVELTAEVMPGVVSLPHGFGHARPGTKTKMKVARAHAGVSINDLTDEQRVDTLCGNAALSGVAVTVTAVA